MRVRLIDGHFYDQAREGDVGELVGVEREPSGEPSPNYLVDWGRGPVRCHVTRFEVIPE